MNAIYGLALSAMGWCLPFLVNWAMYRFRCIDKQTSSIFLGLFATALGCHLCALIVFLCFNNGG